MDMQPILEELERAAAELGVKVSYEVLAETVGGGGLCKVKGTYRVIIDKRGNPAEKAVTLARALAAVGIGHVKLSKRARELVERYAAKPA